MPTTPTLIAPSKQSKPKTRPFRARRTPIAGPWLAALALFAVYAALGVRDHLEMQTTGYDLGIFEQAVRSYAHGHLPVSELKGPGFPLLGDHFSPILATLAPFYLLWPSPLVLLLAQAALLAVAVVPLTTWAHRVAGPGTAWAVAFGYGASWGIAQAAGFDFHEICFAVPLLAYSLAALGQGRMRAAVLWVLPLLLVKEDLGFTVAVVGALVAWRGRLRLGMVTAAAGVIGALAEMFVVIPAFNPDGHYTYTGSLDSSGGGLAGLLHTAASGLDMKANTLVLLLAPTAFLAVRSPLMWAVVPTLAWRFVSDDPAYWGTDYHYSAVLMPVVFAAMVEAVSAVPGGQRAARAQLIAGAAVSALLLPLFPLARLTESMTWQSDPRIAAAQRILDRIPDGATVAASNRLAPQLTNRDSVSVFGFPGSRADPQWIVVDTATPQGWPVSAQQQAAEIDQALAGGYRTVADESGYLLLKRS